MKELHSILIELSKNMGLALQEEISLEELKEMLADHINYLVTHDFTRLLQILYRVDVREELLRKNLENSTTNTGQVIAEMIIERQIEKIRTRKLSRNDADIADDEKW